MPAAVEQSPEPPDWDQVPFAVECARCGHDLRGLTDPECPACGLTFAWSDAVPIKALTCLECGYLLYGLRETRCPECGQRFVWEDVLREHHRRKEGLFEHRWRDRPVRSFVTSCRAALRPGTRWRRIHLHDRPEAADVVKLSGVAMGAFVVAVLVLCWVYFVCGYWVINGTISLNTLLDAVGTTFANRVFRGAVPLGIVWSMASLAALMLFRESMRRYRVRSVHVLRVWAYSVVLPLLLLPAVFFLLFLARFAHSWYVGGNFGETARLVHLFSPIALGGVAIAFVIWSIRTAYDQYLRMAHATAVAVASQCVAGLAVLTVFVVLAPRGVVTRQVVALLLALES